MIFLAKFMSAKCLIELEVACLSAKGLLTNAFCTNVRQRKCLPELEVKGLSVKCFFRPKDIEPEKHPPEKIKNSIFLFSS
jgi:hypothetical protein